MRDRVSFEPVFRCRQRSLEPEGADLSELRSLAHRIVVLRKGAIVAELPPDASDDAIGRAMLGTSAEHT